MSEMDLTKLTANSKGKVTKIEGGYGVLRKAENLGIRAGTELKKISSHRMRGPVIIKVGNTSVAIGYGMAKKIIVTPK
jgi:ferrous iron transport protein A